MSENSKKHFTIKTIDGNRYETDKLPIKVNWFDVNWMSFPVREGVGTKYLNIANVVSLTETEVEE